MSELACTVAGAQPFAGKYMTVFPEQHPEQPHVQF
jgi:hypothetical protein